MRNKNIHKIDYDYIGDVVKITTNVLYSEKYENENRVPIDV